MEASSGRDGTIAAVPLDPIDPGAMPEAAVALTKAQARALAELVRRWEAEERLGAVRLETLRDAHARVILIGPDGDPVDEKLLLPV
jgi:hypothetical protein